MTLYNVGPTSKTLGRRCINVIQMCCVHWAGGLSFNPLNANPEYTRGQKMSPCRGPRVYSGAKCFFLYFCLQNQCGLVIMRVALFLPIQVCFSFDCACIASHNNIWADVELSFLKDYFGTKNFKWPP